MHGDLANKLSIESKRAGQLNYITLNQQGLIKGIVQEVCDLNDDLNILREQEIQLSAEATDNEAHLSDALIVNQCQQFVTQLCMRRNKRCLLGYQKLRATQINRFVWQNMNPRDGSDDSAGHEVSTSQISVENLSHPEQDYLRQYQDLVQGFKSSFSGLDLSGDLIPPTNIFIDVRVLRDGGEIQTEYGVFNLIKDSQFFVRKSDVARLILQGYLEEI